MAFFIDFHLHETSHRAARAVRQGRTIGSHTETPQIPLPEIFELAPTALSPAGAIAFPTVFECATHLELLHSIYRLHHDVQSAPSIQFIGQTVNGELQPQEVRNGRWNLYVSLAVLRFLKWMHVGGFPPLDILMVWQACLLNPIYFSKICTRRRCEQFRKTPFPWKDVHAAIQPDDGVFRYPQEAQTLFAENSGLSPDLLEQLSSTDQDCILRHISSWLPSDNESVPVPTIAHVTMGNAIATTLHKRLGSSKYGEMVTDIAAAVDRQYRFIEKMEQHLWLRSPAVHGTLRRALSRYEKFVELLNKYPNITLVPTLDIDLAWHTHQCAGAAYQEDMEKLTGAFIDHNDNIGASELKGGESKAAVLFKLNFESEYLRCFCWDCETVLSELENAERSGKKIDSAKGREIAKRVVSLVSSYKAAELARQNGFAVGYRN